MPTYNHSLYIREAIESVLNQKTNFKVQLYIVDDCSTDDTYSIVLNYAKKYSSLIIVSRNDKNIGGAANGAKLREIGAKSGAKYVSFLEGDDYWIDPNKLQKQVDFMEANEDYSMCFTDSFIVEDKFDLKRNRVDNKNKKDIEQLDILNGFVPPTNTILFRNKDLKTILPDFPILRNGDYFLAVMMSNHGKIGYLDFNSAVYRIHQNGEWSRLPEEHRRQSYTRTLLALKGKVKKSNQQILENMINSNLSNLRENMLKEDYTDDGLWTPQTAMLRSIRDAIIKIDGSPQTALSIDNNPTIENMLLLKWPGLEITKTQWPEYDAQNLYQFKSETFDIVFSHQVLEHIPKPWLAASEMNRVLKKGGIGIHSSCAYNPRHGYPEFKDYYRFLPDGLAELFEDVNIWVKEGWGSKEALIYNLTIDDGHGQLGGRRFVEALGRKNDENYPWHTWVIFQKK